LYDTKFKNNKKENTEIYDYLFVGFGASNILILLSLAKQNLLENKKVAVLEPHKKNTNDKTYCFWAKLEDPIVKDLESIISHSYQKVSVNGTRIQNIADSPYYYIKSIDLYKLGLQTLNQLDIPLFDGIAENIIAEENYYVVNNNIRSKYIFDSRPPKIHHNKVGIVDLKQSFLGFYIECEKEVFQSDTFEMMNFNIDQSNYTQFVYILPFDSRKALIELTRFGNDMIDMEYAQNVLKDKLTELFGNYKILDKEFGCIPMTNQIFESPKEPGILNTGTRANLIKPSTGYGFKRMYDYSLKVVNHIKRNDFESLNKISSISKPRFRFYDTLLLIILSRFPNQGKRIFSILFQKQNIGRIFSFLDEKTTLKEEVLIFARLPIFIFIKSLFIYLRTQNFLRYIITFLIIISYLLISGFDSVLSDYLGYSFAGVGLLVIGIPHGAVDHLLLAKKKFSLITFVAKYLAISVIYFALWFIMPLLSLVFFILYSSFHFGESEYEQMGLNSSSIKQKLNNVLLGLAILLSIIFSHSQEAISIVSNIPGLKLSSDLINSVYKYEFVIVLSSLLYVFIKFLICKKTNMLLLLLILLIGTLLPLYLGFAIFFIIQHSGNSWQHLKKKLTYNNLGLYKKALPFSLGAFLLLGLNYLNDTESLISTPSILSYFFIFLACISLPHVVLMHLFYKEEA
jgi:lycopene beta-cyclase